MGLKGTSGFKGPSGLGAGGHTDEGPLLGGGSASQGPTLEGVPAHVWLRDRSSLDGDSFILIQGCS